MGKFLYSLLRNTNLHSFWYGSNLVFSEVLKGFELYECLFYLFIQIIELLYQALGSWLQMNENLVLKH